MQYYILLIMLQIWHRRCCLPKNLDQRGLGVAAGLQQDVNEAVQHGDSHRRLDGPQLHRHQRSSSWVQAEPVEEESCIKAETKRMFFDFVKMSFTLVISKILSAGNT